MKRITYFLLTLLLIFTSTAVSFAGDGDPEMADAMRSNGKIYVIVAIVLIVLAGLISYLFLLDRKVGKLENLLAEKTKKRG